MDLFLQSINTGIVLGSVYTLLAMGLSMTFSIMKIVNFAHGELFMLGCFITWLIVTHFIGNFWIALSISLIAGVALGIVIERLFRPVYGKNQLYQLTIAFGLVVILQQLALIILGPLSRKVTSFYPTVRAIGRFTISDERILIVVMTLAILLLLALFFKLTKTGKAMRATTANRLGAQIVGIRTNQMAVYAVVGGVTLAVISGVLLAPIFSVEPFMGTRLTGVAFVVIVIGGIGSVSGAAIAGYSIGIIESLFSAYGSLEWGFAPMFVALILVLLFRPLGLLGKEIA